MPRYSPIHCPHKRLPASGPVKHGPDAGSFYVASVQRNPDTEVPEAPSTENRIEDRNGGVAAIVARPEVALCLGYAAVRPVPPVVPTTGRRRTVPATRRRRAVPVRRRPTGRRPIIPAESSRWRRRRRAVVACAEAARRIRWGHPPGHYPDRKRPSASVRQAPVRPVPVRPVPGHPVHPGPPVHPAPATRPRSTRSPRSARSRSTRSRSARSPRPPGPPGPAPPGPPGPGPAQVPVRQAPVRHAPARSARSRSARTRPRRPRQARPQVPARVRQVLALQGPARATVRQDVGPQFSQSGGGFNGAALASSPPTVSADMPTPAAIAAPATRFTYMPVRPFRAPTSTISALPRDQAPKRRCLSATTPCREMVCARGTSHPSRTAWSPAAAG